MRPSFVTILNRAGPVMSNVNLGRVKHHDPKSRHYPAPLRAIQTQSVLHTLDAPVLDQFYLNGCTGFAGAQWLNCARNLAGRRIWNQALGSRSGLYIDNNDAISLYGAATQYDDFGWQYPPDDEGSSGLGVAKALKASGVITRYEWTFSFDQFIAALQAQPVLLGTAWTDTMMDPNRKGVIRVGTTDLDGTGGHEYLARGINWPRRLVRIRNSWNKDWGINGDAYIPFTDMERLLDADGDVVVPILK